MTEQSRPANGTVAEEAARLIEAMASIARSSAELGQGPSPYAGGPAWGSHTPDASGRSDKGDGRSDRGDGRSDRGEDPSNGACSACGGERDSTPVACKLCPLCQGIAFLRSVRPETVDRLADLASAVAASLRDVATQSRASGPASDAGPASGRSSRGGRAPVQDIHVDDEDEG